MPIRRDRQLVHVVGGVQGVAIFFVIGAAVDMDHFAPRHECFRTERQHHGIATLLVRDDLCASTLLVLERSGLLACLCGFLTGRAIDRTGGRRVQPQPDRGHVLRLTAQVTNHLFS